MDIVGLVAEYLFDGNANDTSGNGYNLSGDINYFPSNIEDHQRCSSIGQYGFGLVPLELFQGTNSFTISLWLYMGGGSQGELICEAFNPYSFQLKLNSDKTLRYIIKGSTDSVVHSIKPIVPDVWTHIVITRDNQWMKIYINGVLDNTQTVDGSMAFATKFTIGASGITVHGYYDNCRIYNRELTAAEVGVLYSEFGQLPIILKPIRVKKYSIGTTPYDPFNIYNYPYFIEFWWQYSPSHPVYRYKMYSISNEWFYHPNASDPTDSRLYHDAQLAMLVYQSIDGGDWQIQFDTQDGNSPYKVRGVTRSNFTIYQKSNLVDIDGIYYRYVPFKPIRIKKAIHNGTSWELKPIRIKKYTS